MSTLSRKIFITVCITCAVLCARDISLMFVPAESPLPAIIRLLAIGGGIIAPWGTLVKNIIVHKVTD